MHACSKIKHSRQLILGALLRICKGTVRVCWNPLIIMNAWTKLTCLIPVIYFSSEFLWQSFKIIWVSDFRACSNPLSLLKTFVVCASMHKIEFYNIVWKILIWESLCREVEVFQYVKNYQFSCIHAQKLNILVNLL